MQDINTMTILELLVNYWYIGFLFLIRIAYVTSGKALLHLSSIDEKLTLLHTDNEVQKSEISNIKKWISSLEHDLKECARCTTGVIK